MRSILAFCLSAVSLFSLASATSPDAVDGAVLEARQGVPIQNPDAPGTVVTQAGPVTTWAVPPNYVNHIYTVTFAPVPDQWPSPGVGSIGYGTLQQKRDVPPEPTITGIAGRVRP